MARPSKPITVLKSENGKSHRTKAEIKTREQGEKALLTGERIKESKEVRNNKVAHEKFKRIISLLDKIEKTDALYEVVINRYCILYAETLDIIQQRQEIVTLLEDVHKEFQRLKENDEIGSAELANITQSFSMCLGNLNKLDDTLQKKRKMLLDIEKENIMTIAAALRCVPKTPEETKGPSLKEILGG